MAANAAANAANNAAAAMQRIHQMTTMQSLHGLIPSFAPFGAVSNAPGSMIVSDLSHFESRWPRRQLQGIAEDLQVELLMSKLPLDIQQQLMSLQPNLRDTTDLIFAFLRERYPTPVTTIQDITEMQQRPNETTQSFFDRFNLAVQRLAPGTQLNDETLIQQFL
jgi:hypothetical protein